MNKRELHKHVKAEMVEAANKVVVLREEQAKLEKEIKCWEQHEKAARAMACRLDIEATRNGT